MGAVTIFILCGFFVCVAQWEVILEPDRPSLPVEESHTATLQCCYKPIGIPGEAIWTKTVWKGNQISGPYLVNKSDGVDIVKINHGKGKVCSNLTFTSVTLDYCGLYRCKINGSMIFTHGTYLQVYQPLQKMINLSEDTKNMILTAEGVLLLLCVVLPSAVVLSKSKRLRELERKKMRKEEENIYQGLHLDDCSTAYDQIERQRGRGPYQDVGNMNEDDIQLEKP